MRREWNVVPKAFWLFCGENLVVRKVFVVSKIGKWKTKWREIANRKWERCRGENVVNGLRWNEVGLSTLMNKGEQKEGGAWSGQPHICLSFPFESPKSVSSLDCLLKIDRAGERPNQICLHGRRRKRDDAAIFTPARARRSQCLSTDDGEASDCQPGTKKKKKGGKCFLRASLRLPSLFPSSTTRRSEWRHHLLHNLIEGKPAKSSQLSSFFFSCAKRDFRSTDSTYLLSLIHQNASNQSMCEVNCCACHLNNSPQPLHSDPPKHTRVSFSTNRQMEIVCNYVRSV